MTFPPSVRRIAVLVLGILLGVPAPATASNRPAIDAAARDDAGNVYVTGVFPGASINIGGIVLTKSPASGADLFVAMLKPGGAAAWAGNFGSDRSAVRPAARAIAVDDAGTVFVAGSYAGGSLDDLRLPTAEAEAGFVVRFDQNGRIGWSRPIADSSLDIGDLALDASAGAVFLSGAVDGMQPQSRRSRDRDADAVVARFDAATGTQLWLRRIPGAGRNPLGQAIVLDREARQLYLAGDVAAIVLPKIVRPDRDGRFVLRMPYDGGDADPMPDDGMNAPPRD